MVLSLEINQKVDSRVKDEILNQVIKTTLEKAGCEFSNLKISLACICEDEMQKVNFRYRKKDKPTDVLSFCFGEENMRQRRIRLWRKNNNQSKEIFLGEILLCPDFIRKKAKEEKVEYRKLLIKVLSHGTLHLLGFSHGKEMFEIQEKVS